MYFSQYSQEWCDKKCMRKSERALSVSINKNSQYVEALYQYFNWKYFSFLYFWHTLWQLDQGSNPCLPSVGEQSLNHWTCRKFWNIFPSDTKSSSTYYNLFFLDSINVTPFLPSLVPLIHPSIFKKNARVCTCVYVCVCVLRCVQLFLTPWTVACHVPLSMQFSRQEYWVGCHFLL